jgi:tetraacyldisaccharide 4'-kinase
MREPHFWRALDPRSRGSAPLVRALLTPLSRLYAAAGRSRISRTQPTDPGLPVVCVGNLTLGGAGKTPVSAWLRDRLTAEGWRVATLSRGYGGRLKGPLKVDAARHASAETGDEPLMMAQTGESWIARNRILGARAMREAGVGVVIMDDGHQNPVLLKSVSIVVIDASEPFGNGHVFPKGPLREPVSEGLARADIVVLMGEGPRPSALSALSVPVLRARLEPAAAIPPGRYVAFAGIGRPERFFDALRRSPGVELVETVPFDDHHAFTPTDLSYLMTLAAERSARLITTSKDHVRLSADMREKVLTARVQVRFEDEQAFLGRILPALRRAR